MIVLAKGTAAGTTQCRLSTVNGTAFLDGDGTIPVTSYIGEVLEITDSAGKKISGVIKAAGGGETLDSEILTGGSWVNGFSGSFLFETFTSSGSDISQAVNDAGDIGLSIYSHTSQAAGRLLKLVYTLAITSGTLTNITGIATGLGYGDYRDSNYDITAGTGTTSYRNCAVAQTALVFRTNSVALDAAFTSPSLKQVTVPSATGCTIVTVPSGTTYNWSYQDSSFNPNSATWSWRIISSGIPGVQVASGALTASNVHLATVDGGSMVEISGTDLSAYAGSDAFTPPTDNLQLWLKADAGCYTDAGKSTACASDGDKVYTWADQSGNGNDAVQATEGNRPLWKTNIVGTLPAVRFDGSDDSLGLPAYWSKPMTVYAVAKVTSILASSTVVGRREDGGYDWRIKGNNVSRYDGAPKDTYHFGLSNIAIITATETASSMGLGWQNGKGFGGTGSALSSYPTNNWSIGNNGSSIPQYMAGDIYEILIYNAAHSDTTRTQIERYLAGKWGISYTPTVYGNAPAKYLVCLYDSSSRVACGYAGAAGGGEALSTTEKVTNPDMELDSDWTVRNGTPTTFERSNEQAHGGTYSWKMTVDAADEQGKSAVLNLTSGALYKLGVWVYGDGTHNLYNRIWGGNIGAYFSTSASSTGYTWPASWTQETLYVTAMGGSDVINFGSGVGQATGTWYLDDATCKQVTDIGTTGLHLHSTPNATDRKMAYKASGFDPNAVTSYKIYRIN